MPSAKDIKDWYNDMYAKSGAESMRPFEAYSVFLEFMGAESGKKHLDVSCGTGYLLLASTKAGLETYGVDISEEAVKVAKSVTPESKIEVCPGEDLKFDDGTFDFVSCLGSLEHFLDMSKGLQEMKRVAKDSARFCIVVPNSRFIYWKFTSDTGTEQQDINETLMTDKQWRELFVKNDFEIIGVHQDKWFMKRIRIFVSANPFKIIKNAMIKLIWSFLPLDWTYQFIYIMRKAK
ncbi:MAG: class I SAM-dependent methyltransferase [candidate division Zixibacteria bacterium]|nr:class I SAM-dependent methyltransferase [candidate division Zixibacteria bacterium]